MAAAQREGYMFGQRPGGSRRPEHPVGRASGGGHLAHIEHGAVRWWFRSSAPAVANYEDSGERSQRVQTPIRAVRGRSARRDARWLLEVVVKTPRVRLGGTGHASVR